MEERERIPVYIKYKKGKTVCICHRGAKKCKSDCTADVVERDKFANWMDTFKTDRYGRTK